MSGVRVTTYDPAEVQVSVGGFIISGFAQGRLIEYRPEQDVISDGEGVDGEVARWARNNPLSTLTLALMQGAASNFTLNTLLNVDRLTLAGVLPILITDRNGAQPTRLLAGQGWVKAQPDIRWSATAEPREWQLRMMNTIHDIHGY